jgi:flagellar hook-associated protein 2
MTPVMTNQQAAADAALTIDGLPVSATGNVVTDAISGLTLNLENADPDTPVHVDVEVDSEGIYEQVKAFVDAYNDVMAYVQSKSGADGELADSTTARGVVSRLESIFIASLEGAGSITMFAQMGITRGDERQYDFDKDEFLDALSASYGGVRDFFIQRESGSGKAYLIDQAIDSMTDSIDGVFKFGQRSLDDRIDNIDDSIDRYERSVESYRTTLERRFLAMESMVAQLQAQGNYLASMMVY